MMTIGTDPEFFTQDENGEVFPFVGIIPGTKEDPLHLGDGFAIQQDNVMLEVNPPPSETEKEFTSNMQKTMDLVNGGLKDYGVHSVLDSDGYAFSKNQLRSKEAKQFGCSPDFDIINQEYSACTFKRGYPYRFASGHIHIGYDNPSEEQSINIASWLDLMIGLPLAPLSRLLFSDEPNKKKLHLESRRTYYGQPGKIRFKPYGLEYRTPSNSWIHLGENTHQFIFKQCKKAFDLSMRGPLPMEDSFRIKELISNVKYQSSTIKRAYNELRNKNKA